MYQLTGQIRIAEDWLTGLCLGVRISTPDRKWWKNNTYSSSVASVTWTASSVNATLSSGQVVPTLSSDHPHHTPHSRHHVSLSHFSWVRAEF